MWGLIQFVAIWIGYFVLLVCAFAILTLICRSFVEWRRDRAVQAGFAGLVAHHTGTLPEMVEQVRLIIRNIENEFLEGE